MSPRTIPRVAPSGALFAARCALVVALFAMLMWSSSPGYAAGILPGKNPKSNIAPTPDFNRSGQCAKTATGFSCDNPCVTSQLAFPRFTSAPACIAYVLKSVAFARKAEGLAPMVLPTNFSSITPAQQLFVLADLERVDRGLPPYLGLNAALSKEAQRAALSNQDPRLAPGFAAGVNPQGYYAMGGTWASGFTTLGASYFWMYSDGWGGNLANTSNLSCTSPNAPACWAHRDQLLGFDPAFNPGVGLYCKTCEMGTGFAITRGYASFVDLVEMPAGTPPPMTFTWAKNVVPYLPKSSPPTPSKKTKATASTVTRRAQPATAWRLTAPSSATPAPLCETKSDHGPGNQMSCKSHDQGHQGKSK